MKIKRGVIIKRSFFIILIVNLLISFTSAGVGIKWSQESALINEGEKTCLTYQVYNPWSEDSYVTIELNDNAGELKKILTEQESEKKLIPANTPSSQGIPMKFCFKAPKIYQKNCLIGNFFICEKECSEEQVMYEGSVSVRSIPKETSSEGSGDSSTAISVSAPLRIRINCDPYEKDFGIIYILLGLVSLLGIIYLYIKKNNKNKNSLKKQNK